MPCLFTSVLTVSNRIACSTKPIDATFVRRLPAALAEKIWNETNLKEVWRHLNGR